MINLAHEIEGTQLTTILASQVGGGSQISFRTRGDLTASEVAKQFDGGRRVAARAFIEIDWKCKRK